jgi:2-polyprenyl-3-methyl-5-hydroxy-6-metoxy-1,4-benzoquinol methylase
LAVVGARTVPEVIDAATLSAIARTIYVAGPIGLRKLQHWRPYICPFERLVPCVRDGSRVLDIGCGAGLLLCLLVGLGRQFEGFGFDVSQPAINMARQAAERLASLNPKARLSFECLEPGKPWPNGAFDVVYMVDVLHHISSKSQRAFLRQALSKLGIGGTLVYKDMCIRPRWRALANRLHDMLIARQWISYVPIETIEQWVRSEGKEVIAREDLTRFCYGHELRVVK